MDTVSIIGALAGQLLVAGAIYGGIRADLRHMRERIAQQDDAIARAHERIDHLTERRGR